MADKKVSELTSLNNLSGDDLLLVVNDPDGTPSSRKTSVSRFFANVSVTSTFNDTVRHQSNVIFTGTSVISSANLIADGLNVADTIRDRMQVANTLSLVNDRIEVANADAKYLSANTPRATGTLFADGVFANSIRMGVFSALNFTISNTEPTTSNNEIEGYEPGTFFISNNHLYVAVSFEKLKRVDLSDF